MEGEKNPLGPGLLRRARSIAGKLAKVYSTEISKVPVDEINEQTVARTIYNQLGNSLQERLKGNRWENPFSPVDVLANSGYVGVWRTTDYRQKFPEPHSRTRQALQQLVNRGILAMVSEGKPDDNNETIYYKVVDEAALKKMAEESKGISSGQPQVAK